MISGKILEYLRDLAANNNREWFHDNKSYYTEARGEFEEFVGRFIAMVADADPTVGLPSVKDSIYRINRDVRFSNDKRPYKRNFSCFVANGGRKSLLPGYYIQFEPQGSLFGGGLWCPEADMLKKVRTEISFFPEDLEAVLNNRAFKDTFGEMRPDKLKSAPKGYAKDHEAIELLKYKSFLVEQTYSDDELLSASFEEKLRNAIVTLQPLNAFLIRALEAPEEEKIDF